MRDPVTTIDDGHSYEREAIERWLEKHDTSPLTNQPLASKRLQNNFALRSVIHELGFVGP